MDTQILVLEMFRAQCLVLGDQPKETADAIFFHSRGHGDDDGLFTHVGVLMTTARCVVINGFNGEKMGGTKPQEASPGKDAYLRRLEGMSIRRERIVVTKPAFNTKEENEAFLDCAIEYNWRTAIVLGQAHQLLRCMLGMIKSMNDRSYQMRVYAMCPRPVNWSKMVGGSQGAEKKERFSYIADEFIRIPRYQEKGDLASWEELSGYYQRRDAEYDEVVRALMGMGGMTVRHYVLEENR